AYVNFARLGVIAQEYRTDMYGASNSPLHAGIGTDRLIAIWPLTSERVEQRLNGVRTPVSSSNVVRIDVPLDIHDIKARQPHVAREWRERTRAAFQQWLGEGYVVADFVRESTHGS